MESNSRNVYLNIVMALVLIVGTMVFALYRKGVLFTKPSPTPSPSPLASPPRFVATLGGEQFNLTRMAKLTIPAIATSKSISKAEAPEMIQDLILYGANKVAVQSVVYENGQTGWKITGTVDEDLRTTYASYTSLLAPSRGWTEQLFGGHATYFGITEARSASYAVRFTATQPDLSVKKTDVVLEIIKL